MRNLRAVVVGISVVAACAPAWAETGKAVIQSTGEGYAVLGEATFADSPNGLHVSVRVSGVSPGQHGLHVHQFGNCGDQGKAAGGHFNPKGVPHGFLPQGGFEQAHAGDFGNLEVGPDGNGALTLTLPGLSLADGTYTVAGRAVVLHEKADDFGQPTGNAGGRIGCGEILVTG